ncbi:MAG: (Fe-S)-binding protein [Deltaproteobacteria bacterium]|nr:(Fe-S)-binding protein [Deltaproteobacteria bacterium]
MDDNPRIEGKDPRAIRADYYMEDYDKSERVARFLEAFAAILKHSNYGYYIEHASRLASKCGRCTSQCPVYQVTGDPRDVPCERSNLLLNVYRRHFTLGGQLRARVLGEPPLTDADIDRMAEAFYRCTACRRCNLDCPFGLDHGLITHLGRWVLSEIGIVPKALKVAVREQLEGKSGNTSGIPSAAMQDTLEFLEEDLEDLRGIKIPFPVDVEGAEYIFFPAVSDFLLEPDTLMGQACVFHATGDSWTTGTGYFDGINYGLFYNDDLLERSIRKEIEEVVRRKAKKILIGECGHASRTAKAFAEIFAEKDERVPVVSILEYTHQAIKDGKVKLDPDVITERVTYHDPCNMARSGWIIDQPREILRSFCKDFVEMTPRGAENYCCGGGGGTVSIDEMKEFRMEVGGKAKADQLRATGADIVVAPCANCKKQLSEIIEHHELDMELKGLHDLILRAIILPGAIKPGEVPKGEEEE